MKDSLSMLNLVFIKKLFLKAEQLKHDSVHALLCTQAMADQKPHRQMLLTQLSTLRYLLRQGKAVRVTTRKKVTWLRFCS